MIDFCECGNVKFCRDDLCTRCEEQARAKAKPVKVEVAKGLF